SPSCWMTRSAKQNVKSCRRTGRKDPLPPTHPHTHTLTMTPQPGKMSFQSSGKCNKCTRQELKSK
ncbi:hypothetical protein XENOCAPTIV_030403, partial [Xenoophorus captivus]